MQRLISCDEVFDALTTGPCFSPVLSARQLQSHLECCTDCRRFAQSIAPAVAAFRDAEPVAGAARDIGLAMMKSLERSSQPLLVSTPTRTNDSVSALTRSELLRPVDVLWLVAGVFLLGLVLTQSDSLSRSERARDVTLNANANSARHVTNQKRVSAGVQLRSFGVPLSCLVSVSAHNDIPTSPVAITSGSDGLGDEFLMCCTQCHSADKKVAAAPVAIVTAARSCVLCHAADDPSAV